MWLTLQGFNIDEHLDDSQNAETMAYDALMTDTLQPAIVS